MNENDKSFMRTSGIIMGITFLIIPIIGALWSLFTFKRNEKVLLGAWEKGEKKENLKMATSALMATYHAAWTEIGLMVFAAITIVFFFLLNAWSKTSAFGNFLWVAITVGLALQIWAGANGFILANNTK